MSIPYIASPKEYDEYIQRSDALVIYFTAIWCGPCQAIAPIVEQLYQSYQNVQIVKVDLDKNKSLASKYEISSVPTFIFYHKGSEINRLKGANPQGIAEGIQHLSALAPDWNRKDASSGKNSLSGGDVSSAEFEQIKKYIPKGFTVLNNLIFPGDFEALNVLSLDKSNGDLKNFVKSSPEESNASPSIISDADSQLLIHLPLTNISKVYSILVKFGKGSNISSNTEISDDEELQKPESAKIWANRSSIISFEDASSIPSLHNETFKEDGWDDNNWYEIKLKYVRFQNTITLDLFFEGEDEDLHTLIERVFLIGVDGETKNQGKIEKIGE